MLTTSVVLVLREVLEAAVLVALLLALSRHLSLGMGWLRGVLLLATPAIIAYVVFLEPLTDSLDGAGQEVFNALLHALVFLTVLGVVALVGRQPSRERNQRLLALMMLTVTFAAVREIAEIFIFVRGFSANPDFRSAVNTGSTIGACIGISAGFLVYGQLRVLVKARAIPVIKVLLALIGCGMAMQATMLLEQVDWIPADQPLWTTAHWVSEQSILGELLYAVFGYEATPSLLQVVVYSACLLAMVVAGLLGREPGGVS